jgi:hypothetical protein
MVASNKNLGLDSLNMMIGAKGSIAFEIRKGRDGIQIRELSTNRPVRFQTYLRFKPRGYTAFWDRKNANLGVQIIGGNFYVP